MENLDGQVAFITGGAQGIGLSMARALVHEGARVAIADLDRDALDTACDELERRAGAEAVAGFELDVRDREAFASTADLVESRLGPVSVLCNNAGVRLPDSLPELGYELWDTVVGINLDGVYNGVQTFLPRMLERGGAGHIVNTASAAGLATHPNSSLVGSSGLTYRASKSAVIALSEALGFDLKAAGHPIGVTVLCPGLVGTNISSNSAVRGGATAARREQAKRGDAMLHEVGMDADLVGGMVVDAIRDDRLYLHTDRDMAAAIADRSQALLDAMPPPDPGVETGDPR